jgi:chromosome segregation ATPase
VANGDADAEDAPARGPAANASDANAKDDATRVISTPSPMKATVHEKREKDDAPEDVPSSDALAKQDVSDPERTLNPKSPQQQQKKKKKKGGDPEKAARAAHYAAVNAAHAADAAAAARALRGRLDQAKKELETDSDLAEQTRAQLEMLLSERARASTTIAKLRRDREAMDFLLAHQSVALDEAEATIERLRLELREKEALLRKEKTGGVGEPAERDCGGTGDKRGGGGDDDDDDGEARSERE